MLGETMETRRDSGDAKRLLLGCETGFHGGVIEKTGRRYIAAAFSGGSSEDDVEISHNAI